MKLIFVGDVMIGRLVNNTLKTESPQYPWGDTLPLFASADWRMCNLECVLSDDGEPRPRKIFCFLSDAKNIDVLKAANIDMVSLANNHVLDYGHEALRDTLALLDDAGIAYAGAGENVRDASRLAVSKCGNEKIGVLAATDGEEEWEAGKEQVGVYYVPIDLTDDRAKQFIKSIRDARKSVDILIVSLHWGTNWGYTPEKGHEEFAHALIDAGADIVFGHSCHVCRGVERYHDGVIFYSVGNFIDDYAVDVVERNDESFIFVVEIDDQKNMRILMYPTMISLFQAHLADDSRRLVIAARMEELCSTLGTRAVWSETENALTVMG